MRHCIPLGRIPLEPGKPPAAPLANARGTTLTYQADPAMTGYVLIYHASEAGKPIRMLSPGDDWQPPDSEDWGTSEFLLSATPESVGAGVFIAAWL